jgi:hypothetical protein
VTPTRPSGSIDAVIRNAVIHVANEQPLLADLFGIPAATDAGLLCTNLRMMDGKRPIFIDNITATFFFPYRVIRFLEIPPGAIGRHADEGGDVPVAVAASEAGTGDAGQRLPVLAIESGEPAQQPSEVDPDLDIDEDFLQRVRDI